MAGNSTENNPRPISACEEERLHYDAEVGDARAVARHAAHAKSRERRRQGDVIVRLEIGPNMTANLVALGWLLAPDRVDHDALASALGGLIDQAIAIRVTPSTIESESVCLTPSHVTAGPIAIGSDENAPQSPRLATPAERGGPQGSSLGSVEPGEVLVAAEIVGDKPSGDRVDAAPPPTSPFADMVVEHGELSRPEPPEAQPWAEATQPFEVDPTGLWGPRLHLWLRRGIWAPGWGPRPGQDGCLVPGYLL
jgi:hypothetical protein